jgi:hypothetical protein
MKEKDFKDCLVSFNARKISPDVKRSESLKEVATERINLIKEINERNCNFVFEDYYTSILEILQSIVFRDGFNILNHICLGFYLRDVLKREDLFQVYNDLRYKRNSLTYYGKRMDYEVAQDTIKKCRKIIKELEKL